jgi:MerR family mercuric resistance operon transcriptional regulator
MDRELTIGTLARAAGVNVETIRYYQPRRLLEEPPKPLRSHRRYPPEVVKRVRFIKRAQQLGFTLEEVTSLLTLEDGRSCRETRLLAEQKLAVIETRIHDLSRMRRLLKGLVAECARGKRPRACPIITSLTSPPSGSDAATLAD